jgi:hypothetical protein
MKAIITHPHNYVIRMRLYVVAQLTYESLSDVQE